MTKTKVIYAIYTMDDEWHGSIKEYCATRPIAERQLNNYRDWYHDEPPKPDDNHIIELKMTIK